LDCRAIWGGGREWGGGGRGGWVGGEDDDGDLEALWQNLQNLTGQSAESVKNKLPAFHSPYCHHHHQGMM
jgi:hypothetical protein